ncbi:MAG: hypothetical protein J5543_01085 [Bacteroidales bacterium]|jgi:hypothetical protein|nr:hypothetical protein [Bacteroidales bacterium]
MGLLKSLFNVAVKAANEYAKQKEEQQKYHKEESHYNREERQATSYTSNDANKFEDDFVAPADWNEYFEEILRTEFPQYTIEKQVPVTNLAGFAADYFQLYETRPMQAYKAEWGQPYTYVLKKAGIPVGVLMTGYGSCHSRQVKYLISRMYAKKMGLPYIGFYLDMQNRREYVVGRIRKFMNA